MLKKQPRNPVCAGLPFSNFYNGKAIYLYKFSVCIFSHFMTARKAIKIVEWSIRAVLYLDIIDNLKSSEQSIVSWDFFNTKLKIFPAFDNHIYQQITYINGARLINLNINLISLYLDYHNSKMTYSQIAYFMTIGTIPTAIAYFIVENQFNERSYLISKYENLKDFNEIHSNQFLADKKIIHDIAFQDPFMGAIWNSAPEFWFKSIVDTILVHPSTPRIILNIAASIAYTCFNFGRYELLQLKAINLLRIADQQHQLEDVIMPDTAYYSSNDNGTAREYKQISGDSSTYSVDEL